MFPPRCKDIYAFPNERALHRMNLWELYEKLARFRERDPIHDQIAAACRLKNAIGSLPTWMIGKGYAEFLRESLHGKHGFKKAAILATLMVELENTWKDDERKNVETIIKFARNILQRAQEGNLDYQSKVIETLGSAPTGRVFAVIQNAPGIKEFYGANGSKDYRLIRNYFNCLFPLSDADYEDRMKDFEAIQNPVATVCDANSILQLVSESTLEQRKRLVALNNKLCVKNAGKREGILSQFAELPENKQTLILSCPEVFFPVHTEIEYTLYFIYRKLSYEKLSMLVEFYNRPSWTLEASDHSYLLGTCLRFTEDQLRMLDSQIFFESFDEHRYSTLFLGFVGLDALVFNRVVADVFKLFPDGAARYQPIDLITSLKNASDEKVDLIQKTAELLRTEYTTFNQGAEAEGTGYPYSYDYEVRLQELGGYSLEKIQCLYDLKIGPMSQLDFSWMLRSLSSFTCEQLKTVETQIMQKMTKSRFLKLTSKHILQRSAATKTLVSLEAENISAEHRTEIHRKLLKLSRNKLLFLPKLLDVLQINEGLHKGNYKEICKAVQCFSKTYRKFIPGLAENIKDFPEITWKEKLHILCVLTIQYSKNEDLKSEASKRNKNQVRNAKHYVLKTIQFANHVCENSTQYRKVIEYFARFKKPYFFNNKTMTYNQVCEISSALSKLDTKKSEKILTKTQDIDDSGKRAAKILKLAKKALSQSGTQGNSNYSHRYPAIF